MDEMKETILQLYQQHHSGKENAISRKDFMAKYSWSFPGGSTLKTIRWGLFNMTDRDFRRIYSQLPIVTCEKGGFYPIRPSEIEEFREYMWKKAIPHFERFNRVRDAHYPELTGDIDQLELFYRGR